MKETTNEEARGVVLTMQVCTVYTKIILAGRGKKKPNITSGLDWMECRNYISGENERGYYCSGKYCNL